MDRTVQAERSAGARREARREALLAAAFGAIARHGPAVSMDQIAAEAGVTKPILYRHFRDKRGLVAAVTLRYLAELRAALAQVEAPDLRTLTRRQLDQALRYLETRPGLLEFINRERGFEESADRAFEHAEPFVAFVRSLLLERGLDPDAAGPWAVGMGSLFNGACTWWLRTRAMPRERFVEHIVALLWDGLGKLVGESDLPRDEDGPRRRSPLG